MVIMMVKLIFEPYTDDAGNEYVFIKVIYTIKEWNHLEELYRSWNLEKYHTNRLFDKYEADVYRYRGDNERLRQQIISMLFNRRTVSDEDYAYIRDYIVDDINKPLIYNYLINLAIFRVIPQKCDSKHYFVEFMEDANLIYLPFTKHFREVIMMIHALANEIDYSRKKLIVYVRAVD